MLTVYDLKECAWARCLERLSLFSWKKHASYEIRRSLADVAATAIPFVEGYVAAAADEQVQLLGVLKTLRDALDHNKSVREALFALLAVLDNPGMLEVFSLAFLLWIAGLLLLLHSLKMYPVPKVPEEIHSQWMYHDKVYQRNPDILIFRRMMELLETRVIQPSDGSLSRLMQAFAAAKDIGVSPKFSDLPFLHVTDIVGGGSRQYREPQDDSNVSDVVNVQGEWTKWMVLIARKGIERVDVKEIPVMPGVYELAVKGSVAYVGKTKDVRKRLYQHQGGSHIALLLHPYVKAGFVVECRWCVTPNPDASEKLLLEHFDYAFNSRLNEGSRAVLEEFPEESNEWRSMLDIAKSGVEDRLRIDGDELQRAVQQLRAISEAKRQDVLFLLGAWDVEGHGSVLPTDIRRQSSERKALQ
jgi:hypothetical protein